MFLHVCVSACVCVCVCVCVMCENTDVWAPKSLQMVTAAMKLKDAYSLEGKL